MKNTVTLIGNVGSDPETKHVGDNQVTNFSLATSESYKDRNGEKVKETEWHNIVLWRGLSKVAESYVKKGYLLSITGKIKSRTYENKEGQKVKVTDIVGSELIMLGGKKQDEGVKF